MSYAIGVAEPLSVFISSYGTGIKSDADLLKIVKANFDLRPGKIVKYVFCQHNFLLSHLLPVASMTGMFAPVSAIDI